MNILEFILILFIAGKYILDVKTKDITPVRSGVTISDNVVLKSADIDFYEYNRTGKGRRGNCSQFR